MNHAWMNAQVTTCVTRECPAAGRPDVNRLIRKEVFLPVAAGRESGYIVSLVGG
jgi:hypothetical protein